MSATSSTESRRLVPVKNAPGIYRRGERYVVRYRDSRGKARKKFARTLAEARELRATLTADVKRGEYRALSKVTFAEYAPEWIRAYAGRTSRGLRPATRRDYAVQLGLDPDELTPLDPARGAVAFFGRMRLAEIEPRDIKAYAAEVAGRKVAGRGVSANTVRLALAPVKAMLATAFEEGLIRGNPAAGVRIAQASAGGEVEEPEEKVKALTEDELRRVLAEVPESWRPLVRLLAATGLRVSEALPLRWQDVDFGKRRLRVRRSLNRGQVGAPKTAFGRRDVPLSKGTARMLWTLRKRPGADARDAALIFPAADGGFLDRGQVYRVVKAAGKRAGVPWIGLHTFRHTAATLAFLNKRNPWNALQVQRLLGHHSAAFTLSTYTHLLPDDMPDPDHVDDVLADESEWGHDGATGPTETGRDREEAGKAETA